MNRVLGSSAAVLSLLVLALPAPALADFSIPSAKQKVTKPATQRPVRRPARPRAAEPEAPTAPIITGIDPALMREVLYGAQYNVTLDRDPAARSAAIQVTDGKTGWRVSFSNCEEDSKCRTMEFYTLWSVQNEANVCTVWNNDVTKDPTHVLGKPYCYTVPNLPRQFHLKLSSDQAPYIGMNMLTPEAARERMNVMIGVWSTYLKHLSDAWAIASSKCPRPADKCT